MPGPDLAFFENANGDMDHIGLILDPDVVIHAWGHVRQDRLDQMGIKDPGMERYRYRLRLIRTLL